MLFNSYVFILAFLSVALILYHALHRHAGARAAIASLVLMSLVFYDWWSPKYLPLLLALMAVNFTIAQLTGKNIDDAITKLRDDRSGYRESHRNEIDQLRRWADVFVKENGIKRHELVVSQR